MTSKFLLQQNRLIAERERRRLETEATRKQKRKSIIALNPKLSEDEVSTLLAMDEDESEQAADAAAATKKAERKKTADALEIQLMRRLGLKAPTTPTAAAGAKSAAGSESAPSSASAGGSPPPPLKRTGSISDPKTRALLEKSLSQRFGLNSGSSVASTAGAATKTKPAAVQRSNTGLPVSDDKRKKLETIEKGLRQRLGLKPTAGSSPAPVQRSATGLKTPPVLAGDSTGAGPGHNRRATADALEKQIMKRLGMNAAASSAAGGGGAGGSTASSVDSAIEARLKARTDAAAAAAAASK